MGINQLPPQAYTRETLMQAFDWIKTQPRQVQDLASSTDALVSIYMQARRRAGNHGVTHPVSSQSFKQDLKNLAEGLRQFEDDGTAAAADAAQTTYVPPAGAPQGSSAHASHHHQVPMQHQAMAAQQAPPPQYQAAQFHAPPPQQMAPPPHQMPPQHHHQAQHIPQQQIQPQHNPPQQHSRPMANPYAADSAVNHLDSKSIEVVRLVQSRFNLSSESEALRMLISLGFEKVREIFPKS